MVKELNDVFRTAFMKLMFLCLAVILINMFTFKNQTFVGTHLYQQVLRHQAMYPHISFTFVKREEVCQTIWDTLSV